MEILLIFILGHFISDFVTQTDPLSHYKREYWPRINRGIIEHILHHFGLTLFLLLIFQGFNIHWKIWVSLLLICMVHYMIDWLKEGYTGRIIKRSINQQDKSIFHYLLSKHTTFFMLDQLIHLLMIYGILYFFNQVASPAMIRENIYQWSAGEMMISHQSKFLIITILVIGLVFVSGFFINNLLKDIRQERLKLLDETLATTIITDNNQWESQDSIRHHTTMDEDAHLFSLEEKSIDKTGRYIGYMERILIGIFVLLQTYSGLALLGAFKTLTRFKQLNDKDFAEYYLMGTLLSMVLGISFSIAIRWILLSF